jgi:hypothetical protein
MSAKPPDRIMQASTYLHEIDGATLEWWYLKVSHGEFRLLATGLSRGLSEILLAATEYVDCPTKMYNVRLRAASAGETETLRGRLPAQLASQLQQEDLLMIHCDEGTFCIWAGAIVIRWLQEPDREIFAAASGPLWTGGPLLADL